MMPATGMDFILKGAKEDDIEFVQRIIDGQKGMPYFDPDIGKGDNARAIPSETLDLPDECCIGLDLSANGSIKIKIVSGEEGIIYYDDADRRKLLEQLVLMFSGYLIADVDLADFMPVFEKNCWFWWTEYKEGELNAKAEKLLEEATKGLEKEDMVLFLQFTNGSLPEIAALELGDEFQDILMQIVTTETEEDTGTLVVFIAG